MWILAASLIVLGAVALAAGALRNRKLQQKMKNGELDRLPEPQPADTECCGQHEVCEKESLLAAVSKKIEYYDDEELDRFAGRASNAYLADEEEEFRNILYTMLETDVAGWVRSLQLRGIELPDSLK